MYKIINGWAESELKNFPDNHFDALITDPPAGISFMGKEWDSLKGSPAKWIEWLSSIMQECYRILKPGAHGLVWALPKISHRTATACELAGFEVRDIVYHLFSSGFPKSMSIGKQIDKRAGIKREVIETIRKKPALGTNPGYDRPWKHNADGSIKKTMDITAPATDLAKQWEGWGTALKPCIEHWILIRKPISEKTITDNVIKYGTGGMNIDGCRVPNQKDDNLIRENGNSATWGSYGNGENNSYISQKKGRWPAQLIHDGSPEVMAEFEKYGESKSTPSIHKRGENRNVYSSAGSTLGKISETNFNDSGSIARFFYCAKPCSAEKNEGIEGFPILPGGSMSGRKDGSLEGKVLTHNSHPTVKSIALMKYLITLITPPGGKIIDPFAGSGTTGIAAELLGFDSVLIEKEKEYFDIMEHRLQHINDYKEPELFDKKEIQEIVYSENNLFPTT